MSIQSFLFCCLIHPAGCTCPSLSAASFDPIKIIEEVEEMKHKFELLEQERSDENRASTTPSKLEKPTEQEGPRCLRNPERPHIKSQHSKRISVLENKVAAYEEQLATLMQVMEVTHSGEPVEDEIVKKRIELAQKILRGENDAMLDRAVHGFQMDEGDSQPPPNGQRRPRPP